MPKWLGKWVSIRVWVRSPGSPALLQCTMTYVSESGAELLVDDLFQVPDRFDLLFSPIAQSWRECLIDARRYESKSIMITFLARRFS
jgi:hypothetical protein